MVEHPLPYKREISLKDIAVSLYGYFERSWSNLKSEFVENPLLAISLFLGILIRLILAPFLGHPYDLRIFMAVGWAVANGVTPYGEYVLQTIFNDISHPHFSGSFYGIGYPPLWGLILGSIYLFYSALSPNNLYFYVFSLKLPIIVGDIIVGIILYKILILKLNKEAAYKIFYFYQFCPFLIMTGVIWGMFDILVFLFSIFSSFTIFNKSDLSAASLAIASSLKPYVIILIPLYSIFIFKNFKSIRKSIRYFLIVFCLLIFITFIPMLVFGWPLSNLYHALSSHMTTTNFYYENVNDYTYGAASPFNVFNVLRIAFPRIKPPDFLNYVWIGVCLAMYAYVFHQSNEVNFKSTINYSFLISLAFFSSRFWVSEQNLIFLLSFFILTVLLNGTQRRWRIIHVFWVLLIAFVFIHVPISGFLWILNPSSLNDATAFCNGPFGYFRWVSMSVLTFSWLGVLYWYSLKERSIW